MTPSASSGRRAREARAGARRATARAAVVLLARAAVVLLTVAAVACGKKGPPLAPFSSLPADVTDVTTAQVGNRILVAFTVPATNDDDRSPANLDRVEVHAFDELPLLFEDDLDDETLVAVVMVRPPRPAETSDEEADPPAPVEGRPGFVDQGAVATIVDTPPPVGSVPVESDADPEEEPAADEPEPFWEDLGPLVSPRSTAQRVYVLSGVNLRGRRGDTTVVERPLITPPRAPAGLSVSYTEEEMRVTWRQVGRGPLQPIQTDARDDDSDDDEADDDAGDALGDAPGADVPGTDASDDTRGGDESVGLAVDDAAILVDDGLAADDVAILVDGAGVIGPPGGTETRRVLRAESLVPFDGSGGYNVYAVDAEEGGEALDDDVRSNDLVGTDARSSDAFEGEIPSPLNDTPLSETFYELEMVGFGRERCFLVRAVETWGRATAESESSERVCVTPVDTFPPAPPAALTAVAGEGAVSLLWNSSPEADLAGYQVLRAEAPGERLQTLTGELVTDASFRDASAQAGVTYTYAVVAVDVAGNASDPSNRVQETGR